MAVGSSVFSLVWSIGGVCVCVCVSFGFCGCIAFFFWHLGVRGGGGVWGSWIGGSCTIGVGFGEWWEGGVALG